MLTRIGNVEIWRILESVVPFMTPKDVFPDIDADALAELQAQGARVLCPETGKMRIPIQGFLLKTPDHVILIDGCVGKDKTIVHFPDWNLPSGARFMSGLAAAGVGPQDVDYVMCTHLHFDHVGWNTQLLDGRWVPTFPNARYIFPADDHAHFQGEAGPSYTESVLPVVEAGQAELVAADHMLGDYVSLVPTPGHTPGHVSVRIADAGRAVVITGDALHSTVQVGRPSLNFGYDFDKPRAAASRRRLLEGACDTGACMIGSHFPLPSLGHVQASGDSFEFVE